MKRKLIVTLVAGALELYAAQSFAQVANCAPVGTAKTASAATPVRSGPLNPVDGFPEYVTDSTGLSLQRCLDPLYCFFDPIIPTDPFSVQIGSGGEAFYWGADNVVTNAAGNRILTYVSAAETAFLQAGPAGEPIDGSQFPFLRLRFTMGVPVDGTYTIRHPFGTDIFTVQGATGARDIFATVDRGLTPNTTTQGPVGPFLKSIAPPVTPLGTPQFIGDAGPTAAGDLAYGGPCHFDPITGNNYVEISGIDTLGNAVDFGTGETVVQSQIFTVQGQIFDGKAQTPVVANRVSYSRTAAGAGQIDAFATTTATAQVTVQDGPTIAAGSSQIPAAVTLDRTALSLTEGIDSASVVLLNPVSLPAVINLTATDLTAATPTDATSLNVDLVDFVDIAQADFDPATNLLTVVASSGDARTPPTLTLRGFGAFAAGNPIKEVATVAPPGEVFVDSSAGGSSRAQVRVIAAVPPAAPTLVTASGITSGTVTLTWQDNADNESGFRVYAVDAAGALIEPPLASVNANVLTATLSRLTAGTAYTFKVVAYNGVGTGVSDPINVSTLALPVAPSAVSGLISPTVSRGINVTFTDNSTDETSFQVQRATTAGGTYATVATVNVVNPATTGAITVTDTSGPPVTSATYFYRVIAVRGPDSSVPSPVSTVVSTPAAPTSNLAPTFGTVTSNSVVVNWARRNTTETGYIVFRAPVTGTTVGTFTAVSGVLGLVTTFTDSSAAPNTTYRYRINAVGWASYNPGQNGAVSANVTTPISLVAPTSVAATSVNSPVVSWVDQTAGETGYRVRRIPQTVNATTGVVTAGTPSANLLANNTGALAGTGLAGSFADTGAARDTLYTYDVAALNGTTAGPATTSGFALAATAGLPTANRPTLTAGTGANATRVTVTWTQPGGSTSVGGYEIQRCAVVAPATACTDFAKVTGAAVNTAGTVDGRNTLTFSNTGLARGTTYIYRMRTVGGQGTGQLGGFSATRTVTTN